MGGKTERLFAYNKAVNPSFSQFKDSIFVPSCAREIVEICAYIENGDNHNARGFLSVFNEKTNQQLLNQVYIANDKRHYNKKRIQVHNVPARNNLSYVLSTMGLDKSQPVKLVILLKYSK